MLFLFSIELPEKLDLEKLKKVKKPIAKSPPRERLEHSNSNNSSHIYSPKSPSSNQVERIANLESEVEHLKAQLNSMAPVFVVLAINNLCFVEYKLLCESLELRLKSEMELRSKVVQQLQGIRFHDYQ